jgi:enoyl-CoA hydratase/carnithine racemase
MSEHVLSSTQGEVTTITLSRPDAGNRLTNAMAVALTAALDGAAASRVIVLRGAGADFCLGRDMQPPPPGSKVSPLDVMREDAAPMIALFEAFRRCHQTVIGVVKGRAWGIGTVFAGICDVTLASSGASFRLAELERGIPPCIAMSPLLDRMPKKALAHLVYSAEEMDAATALQCGLISRIADPAAIEEVTRAFVERLLSFRPEAVAAVKQYLDTAPQFGAGAATLYGANLLSNVLASR